MPLLYCPVSSSSSSSLYVLVTGLCFLVLFQTQTASSAVLYFRNQNHKTHKNNSPVFNSNQTSCDLFFGSWVKDDSLPIYQYSSCPIIDPEFNCQMFGRPDSDYQQFQWRPNNCQLPRFDGLDFLLRMRGKTVMFVGDSLGRNQWESLICMISASVPQSPTQISKQYPLTTFSFMEYGVTLSYYKAPYLVDIDSEQGKRVLKLDDISKNSEAWRGVDVVTFNSGHWWIHTAGDQGWDYIESQGSLYNDMDRLVAYERGLRTWASWIDSNIDRTRTTVVFQAISPTHYNPSEWSTSPASTNCYRETVPVSGEYPAGAYPDQMKVVKEVIQGMRYPPYLLDITGLSELRKDAHPSVYSGQLSPGQRANPERSADCSHWCLPGLPDTWNQLLYTAMFY